MLFHGSPSFFLTRGNHHFEVYSHHTLVFVSSYAYIAGLFRLVWALMESYGVQSSGTSFLHSAFLRVIHVDVCATVRPPPPPFTGSQYSSYASTTIYLSTLFWRDSWVVSSLGHLHGNFMLCRYKNLSLEVRWFSRETGELRWWLESHRGIKNCFVKWVFCFSLQWCIADWQCCNSFTCAKSL